MNHLIFSLIIDDQEDIKVTQDGELNGLLEDASLPLGVGVQSLGVTFKSTNFNHFSSHLLNFIIIY